MMVCWCWIQHLCSTLRHIVQQILIEGDNKHAALIAVSICKAALHHIKNRAEIYWEAYRGTALLQQQDVNIWRRAHQKVANSPLMHKWNTLSVNKMLFSWFWFRSRSRSRSRSSHHYHPQFMSSSERSARERQVRRTRRSLIRETRLTGEYLGSCQHKAVFNSKRQKKS